MLLCWMKNFVFVYFKNILDIVIEVVLVYLVYKVLLNEVSFGLFVLIFVKLVYLNMLFIFELVCIVCSLVLG